MAYIIDTYNDWDQWDRAHSIHTFLIHDTWYAIKEVQLEWGLPILPLRIDSNKRADTYKVYGTKEEALSFILQVRSLN